MDLSEKWAGHPRIATIKQTGKLTAKHEEFTPEKEERRKFRNNKPYYPRDIYFNKQASKDGIRHFVNGIGDTNPLFIDEDYAGNTKYGSIIAPGSYLYTVHWTPRGAGPAGLHGWYCGGDWEWYRPIFAGDEFKVVVIIREMIPKRGRMGAGRTWLDYTDVLYINQKNEIVGKEHQHTIRAERGRAGSKGKYRETPKPEYSREDWLGILETYDNEELRLDEPRYWEDVNIGDRLGPMSKGPLSVRDEIAWLMGGGSPFFRAHKNEFEYEMRHPKVLEYVEETGEADIPELVHIFDSFARAIGVERAYDYGNQRMSWLCNLFTNWIGSDGFLWKMSGDLRVFNQIGDITTFEGKVIKKYMQDDKCCIDVEAGAKNQRDEWSMNPNLSTVILPSKEHGPAVYPDPDPILIEEMNKAMPLDDMIRKGLI